MAINKVVYGGNTLIDLTADTVTADKLADGETAHDKAGNLVIGTAIFSGDSWETLADQNVTVVSSSPNYFVITNYTTPFAAGETYRVTWGQGGTKYICQTIQDETGGSYDGYVIGNPGVVGRQPDTGEPFIIYRDRADRLACATSAAAGTLHLTIERQTGGASYQAKTGVVPTKNSQTVFPDSGYDALSSVQINPIPAAYQDVTGVTAAAGDVVSGKDIVSASGALVHGSLVIQHYYTGSGAPASGLGANGDVYLQTS